MRYIMGTLHCTSFVIAWYFVLAETMGLLP